MPWLLLALACAVFPLAWNTAHPRFRPGRIAVASFMFGWLIGELALHQILLQLVVTGVAVALGGLRAWPGWVGLGLMLWSWTILARHYLRGRDTDIVVEAALTDALGDDYRDGTPPEQWQQLDEPMDWGSVLAPFPIRHQDVERVPNVEYFTDGKLSLKLDVHRRRSERRPAAPVLLYVHGGAWVLGSKDEQGLPMLQHLASLGWVCFTIDYRLSPRATFPDHLVDVKRAIRYIRDHAAEYGCDASIMIISGGSAGGHLASLAALTPNDPMYQPGFESADTSLSGCVSLYGVLDLADRHGTVHHHGLRGLLERNVLKTRLADDPQGWDRASPIARVGEHAPPFLVVQGTLDTLVPVEMARRFVAAFKERSTAPIAYAEIPLAQHAFEIFPSLRALLLQRGIGRFVTWVEVQHRARIAQAAATAEAVEAAAGDVAAAQPPSAIG